MGTDTKRRPSFWIRLVGLPLLALSLFMATGSALALADWLPSDLERYRSYTAATPCPADTTPRRADDCLRQVPYTVERAGRESAGKSQTYRAALGNGPFGNGEVDLGNPDTLAGWLSPGDRVTATVWRGEVLAVAAHDRRQTTENEPRDEPQMPAALGTAAALLAILSLLYGGVLLTGLGYGRITWKRHVWPLTAGLFTGSLVIGFMTAWLGVPWQIVPLVIVLGTAGALRLFLRRVEPAAPRSHRAPGAPGPAL
ncbi:hypothetical protein [Streptomyces filamentosus]|uniref:hypothetical protein n=1 Tax=Streptomyces filamentosus TaxID=67294 RepID=UPI0037D8D50F